jgi:metal-responsive CopG/Arc/MetJ family transcriptional regulator
MIAKTKTSVTISASLLRELSAYNEAENVSDFIEQALTHYLGTLKKRECTKRDLEIINANAERFNRDAEENLLFQTLR